MENKTETETKAKVITTAEEYKKMQTMVSVLPSGATFKLKRKLSYGDYMELMNVLGKDAGETPSVELMDDVKDDPDKQALMIAFIIPRMCLQPKVTTDDSDLELKAGYISLNDISFDDMIYITQIALEAKVSKEVMLVSESFRTGESDS